MACTVIHQGYVKRLGDDKKDEGKDGVSEVNLTDIILILLYKVVSLPKDLANR